MPQLVQCLDERIEQPEPQQILRVRKSRRAVFDQTRPLEQRGGQCHEYQPDPDVQGSRAEQRFGEVSRLLQHSVRIEERKPDSERILPANCFWLLMHPAVTCLRSGTVVQQSGRSQIGDQVNNILLPKVRRRQLPSLLEGLLYGSGPVE